MCWQCAGNVVAVWWHRGGDVAAMWRQFATIISQQRSIFAMSSKCREPCRFHFILMSSLRHRDVVVISSPCRCDVVAVWLSCCGHVTVKHWLCRRHPCQLGLPWALLCLLGTPTRRPYSTMHKIHLSPQHIRTHDIKKNVKI